MVYAYNGIYSALKSKEILIHSTSRISLENIMLHEICQSQDKKCLISLTAGTQVLSDKVKKRLPRAGRNEE